jgi:predicted secreted protein
VLLLDVVSSLKADIATAVETLNCNFKAENVKLAADIISSMSSQLTLKFQAENQKLAEKFRAKFQAEIVKLREELWQKIQNEVTNTSQDFSALRNNTDK